MRRTRAAAPRRARVGSPRGGVRRGAATLLALVALGCSGVPAAQAPPVVDDDADGLDDALEARLAADYLPFLALADDDACPLGGILFRARPHPAAPELVHVVYDHLFERDCGFGGHVGDDEVFAVTIDPLEPPPGGLLALRAIAHQGTPCDRVTECGRCAPLAACETLRRDGADWPVVYSSRGKHAGYVSRDQCEFACLDRCPEATAPAEVMLVNAGEPARPLVRDLTAAGLITPERGWREPELLHFDPWDETVEFGTAGNLAADLVDPAFETPTCR